MSIIKNTATAKKFVDINFINSITSLPDFTLAEQRFLVPLIGQEMYDLVIELADAEVPDDPDLLLQCQGLVAPLGYLLKLPTIQVQLTDAGLRTISSDTMQAAHRWEYNIVRDQLHDNGCYAIEALLIYLYTNAGDYAEWTNSDEYNDLSGLIFKTGTEFNKYYMLHQKHRIFWSLRPLIKEIEDQYMISAMGETFYSALKTAADPSAAEIESLRLIKSAVANYTIVRAIEKRSVTMTENGFSILLAAGNSDAVNSGDYPIESIDPRMDMLYKSCERTGDAYLVQLKQYLNAKASALVFADYFASELYEDPAVTALKPNPNEKRKIFGM